MLPDHTGFPIGEEYGGATYFLMEVHYDNPSLKPGIVDSSGLRIFYTENLRQHDAGILIMGHIITPTHIIPPSHNWLTVGHCHESCTQQNLPSGGIHVFQGVLHSHLLGSSLSLRHIRDGQELPRLIKDMNYDFNYQQSRILKQEVTILPGDHLITECNYDSSRRRAPTFGGFGTEEEMCLAFLGYYPRSNWTHCLSAPRLRTILDGLGVEDIYNKDTFLGNVRDAQESVDEEAETEMARAMSSDGYSKRTKPLHISYMLDKLVIKAPEKYYNKSLYSILHDDATWQDEVLVERLQDLVITGRHELKCPIRHHRTIPGVARTATYPDFVPFEPTDDQCGNNEPGSTSAAMPPAVNPVDNTISA
ncbi:MOXD1 homolog 1-like [Panulirus ornatus]|uniref:MOXD1 homolog 1-like n=1 Tax=Panulirus ornatus TaxID=150431 RepID=UPI003A83AF60